MKTCALVLALFLADAQARPYLNELIGSEEQLEFRPYTNGDTPWYKTSPKAPAGPDYPINYKVNDFGVDQDIIGTKASESAAESITGRELHATFEKPKRGYPIDYKVPNFGADEDVSVTHQNIDEAEKSTGKKLNLQQFTTMPDYPINYDVSYQKLGVDKDIIATKVSADLAEKQLNHKWQNTKAKADSKIKRNYPVPDLGRDHDILTTEKNMKDAEEKLGHKWAPTLVSLEEDLRMEEPIGQAMQRINQKYNSFAQSKDDQICTSTGCPENIWKEKEEGKIVQYPTNVPLDTDIQANIKSERIATEYHGETSSYNEKSMLKYTY